jgi:hypothetical protein
MKSLLKVALLYIGIALFVSLPLTAQTNSGYSIRGIVMEQINMPPGGFNRAAMSDPAARPTLLAGANLVLFTESDTTSQFRGTNAGSDGRFEITRVPNGNYILKVSFVGYESARLPIRVSNEDLGRVIVFMKEDPLTLDEVRISGLRPEVEVRGDTTVYNADGIRLNPDATAEDLVRRLPGITVEDGQVQAQGEQVRRVLVDGQEFFGDDALLTLRNLPAEIIGQIEMFDEQSDQARFTGFNDGNESRALNIRTRPGMNVGQFGRGNGSFGTESRYMGSGNFNYFNGPRRISILGMSNNINQQNFSGDDLSGVNQASSQGGRGGMMAGRGGMQWGGGGAARNFMVGSQSGTNTIHSFGVNYIDRFEKTNINSSYFFNATNNLTNESLERQYTTEVNADQAYNERNVSESDNYNHRLNARIEHTFNPVYSMIITPRVQFRNNDRESFQSSDTFTGFTELVNRSTGINENSSFNYDIANSILLRRRFETRGRTLSANIRTDVNQTKGDQLINNVTEFYAETVINRLTNQNTDINTGGYNLSVDVQYTEPLTAQSQLQIGYTPTLNRDISERDAFQYDFDSRSYTILDPNLTSRYQNITTLHRLSSGYRFNNQKINANVGLIYEYTNLEGEQTFPVVSKTSNSYNYILPNANVRYNLGMGKNVNLNYRANTRMPSASQLQDVIDNSNPIQLRGGNPDLNPQYTHNISTRFQFANVNKATFSFAVVNVSYTADFISNTSFIARADTLIRPGVILGRGSRFSSPENLGGSWNIRSFVNHSRPFKLIKSNVSFNGGVSYTLQPTSDNGFISDAKTIGLNGGSSLNSNISPNVDFSLNYRASYSIVENSENLGINNNYYTGRAFGRVNLLPGGRFLISTDINFTHYSGLGEDFNNNIVYWNASLGFKFMKDNAAEIRLTVVDIMAQNNSVNRVINDGYVEDVRSNVLSRYGLINFSYNFRNFRRG